MVDPLNEVDPSGLYRCVPFAPDPCDLAAQAVQAGGTFIHDQIETAKTAIVQAWNNGVRPYLYSVSLAEAGMFDRFTFRRLSWLADQFGAHVDLCSPDYLRGYGDASNSTIGIGGLRRQYLGKTPGKGSATGRAVIQRMMNQGLIRDNNGQLDVRYPTTGNNAEWYPINQTDMAHTQDAVQWWNTVGYKYGPKASAVRKWMLDANNYQLEPARVNRSKGGQLTETYRLPEVVDEAPPIVVE